VRRILVRVGAVYRAAAVVAVEGRRIQLTMVFHTKLIKAMERLRPLVPWCASNIAD